MTKTQVFISTLMAGLIAATAVSAATMKRNDPNRPVAAISADLGITMRNLLRAFLTLILRLKVPKHLARVRK